MVRWSKLAVKKLYKSLLLFGYQDLKYTDKDYFIKTIKTEFRKHQNLTVLAEKQFHLDKGNYFLKQEKAKLL